MFKEVKLRKIEANEESLTPEHFVFDVIDEAGNELIVPNEPLNRHYHEVKEWYEKQEQKPFEFDFTPQE